MLEVYLIFTSDQWHSNNSKAIIAVSQIDSEMKAAIELINQFVAKNDETPLTEEHIKQLKNCFQTQGRDGYSEFIIETAQIGELI